MKKGSISAADFKAFRHILKEVMHEPAFEEARLYLVEGKGLQEISLITGRNRQTIHGAAMRMWRIYQGYLKAKKEILRSVGQGG